MGEKLKNAPVYFVIGQVRFNPIPMPIRDNIDKIQEGFRQLGYTDYRPQTLQQMQIVVQNNEVTYELVCRWTSSSSPMLSGPSCFASSPTSFRYRRWTTKLLRPSRRPLLRRWRY